MASPCVPMSAWTLEIGGVVSQRREMGCRGKPTHDNACAEDDVVDCAFGIEAWISLPEQPGHGDEERG